MNQEQAALAAIKNEQDNRRVSLVGQSLSPGVLVVAGIPNLKAGQWNTGVAEMAPRPDVSVPPAPTPEMVVLTPAEVKNVA